MNKAVHTFGDLSSAIVKTLPIFPIVGFVFALCYEVFFFQFLGLDMRQILQFTDLFEISVIIIVPLLPPILIGIWLRNTEDIPDADNERQKKEVFNISAFLEKLVHFIFLLGAATYLITGSHYTVGPMILIMYSALLILRFILVPKLGPKLSNQTFYAVIIFLTIATVSATSGAVHANHVRYDTKPASSALKVELQSTALQNMELRLVRRLSGGIVVINSTRTMIWFILNDQSYLMSKELDPEPFYGILCEHFDWCKFSIKPHYLAKKGT